ncbi:sulfate ABC transporter ATP-binding protein [Thermotoga sp. Ku-13t]|uniref:ABC transporter ATP-binding protein n=1 Tax=Thermotoga sp. Ku-13t TaxID=1755813 RepID=UPI0013E9CE91|nr:ABC transporter ATP-binding protein [Thermotoga sp. Ku-13t]KAF2958537.1 sulfate ABC transporter ATP-binding protein [Thermotoga sp. Ku-13t]
MDVLRVEGLRKYYGNVRALDDVSAEIQEGELFAVIGPSGSGKTTLLRSIAGFVQLDAGRIYIKGCDVTDLPPEKRNVAMFFQNYALWPHMTVFQNVAYGLKVRKLSKEKIREKVEWALNFLDIAHLADRKPNQLSGGQQQRVALARAIVVEPDLLLLDEPLSNLDAKIRMRIRFELRTLLKKLNIATLYVTHDQEEALSIADRIAVMNNGKILQVGKPREIYLKPANLFVADFVGVNCVVRTRPQLVAHIGLDVPEGVEEVNMVIRTEEVRMARPGTLKKTASKEVLLNGTVVGKLYIGARTRYEIMFTDLEENIFVNSDEDFEVGEPVQILLKEGSYFLFP